MTNLVSNVEVNKLGVRARGQRRRVQTENKEKSLAKQADKDQADIHKIMKKYQRTGLLPIRQATPITGVLPAVESYQDALQIVIDAKTTFEALPSNIREKFGEDPAQFLAFATDETNLQAMREMGLAEPEVVVDPWIVTGKQ